MRLVVNEKPATERIEPPAGDRPSKKQLHHYDVDCLLPLYHRANKLRPLPAGIPQKNLQGLAL